MPRRCGVPTCRRLYENGLLTKLIPKNADTRELWISQIRKGTKVSDWNPNPSTSICEHHFTKSMFEKTRCDGKRKVRTTAYPVLFDNPDLVNKNKSLKDISNVSKEKVDHDYCKNDSKRDDGSEVMCYAGPMPHDPLGEMVFLYDLNSTPGNSEGDCISMDISNNHNNQEPLENKCSIIQHDDVIEISLNNIESHDAQTVSESTRTPNNVVHELTPLLPKQQTVTYETEAGDITFDAQTLNKLCKKDIETAREIRKLCKILDNTNRQLMESKIECEELKEKVRHFEEDERRRYELWHTQILRSLFEQDQIDLLETRLKGGKKIFKWSNATLENALQIRWVCSDNGYEELLRQNYPLPSLRTLRNKEKEDREANNKSPEDPLE